MYITYFLTIPVLNIKQSITIKNDNLVKTVLIQIQLKISYNIRCGNTAWPFKKQFCVLYNILIVFRNIHLNNKYKLKITNSIASFN